MLIYIYLFALIVGGVLLGASIMLGGHSDTDAGGSHGGFEGLLLAFFSLRFWVFFLAFFGMTGLTMQGLGLVDSHTLGLVLALLMGMGTGLGAVTAIRKLSGNSVSSAAKSDEYIGKSARVVVATDGKSTAKVRVRVRGTEVDLLAESDEPIAKEDEVLIVEMEGTRARIARIDK